MNSPIPAGCQHPEHCARWRKGVNSILDGRAEAGVDDHLAAEAMERCAACRQFVANAMPITIPPPVQWDDADVATIAELAGLSDLLRDRKVETVDVGPLYGPEGQRFPPSPNPNCLGRLGRYDIIEWLGRGGMGDAYRALDSRIGRSVVVKLVLPHLPQLREHLIEEARAQGALDHPGMVPIYDVDHDPIAKTSFLVMAFAEGNTLSKILHDRACLAADEALSLCDQLLTTLCDLHPKGVVHRDIKPSNIMVGPSGLTRLLDFGVARLYQRWGDLAAEWGHRSGTPEYMSPEQEAGHDGVDPRADLYSVGVCLYEMLVGRLPPRGGIGAVNGPIDALPTPLGAVLRKAIEPNRDDRFQSASDFRTAIRSLLQTTNPTAPTGAAPSGVDAQAAVAHWSNFMSRVHVRMSRRSQWRDPIRDGIFHAAAEGPRLIETGGIRHAVSRLTARSRYEILKRRFMTPALHVRVEALLSIRAERYFRSGTDHEPADTALIRKCVEPVLTEAMADGVFVIVLVSSPTGFTKSATEWARVTGLGEGALIVLWPQDGSSPISHRRPDVLPEPDHFLGAAPKSAPDEAEICKWVMEALVYRPSLGVDELASHFNMPLADAEAAARCLSASQDLVIEEFTNLGKVLRHRVYGS